MEFGTFAQILSMVIGLITAVQIVNSLTTTKKSTAREEYQFTKDFLDSVAINPDMHPLVRDRGYRALAGDKQMPVKEVEYVISLIDPDTSLRRYTRARDYLQFEECGSRIDYAPKYKKTAKRTRLKTYYLTSYLITAMIALSPFPLTMQLSLNLEEFLGLIIFTLPAFGLIAVYSALEYRKIKTAEKFMTEQRPSSSN